MSLTSNQLYGFFLLAIILGIGVIVIKVVFLAADEGFDEFACRAEVEAHSGFLKYTGREFASKIDCPTGSLVTVEEDHEEWIAEEMRKCWFAFAEGTRDLFTDEYVFCHPCRVFEIDEPVNVFDYMKDTNIPLKNITYFDYLQGFTTDDAANTRELRGNIENLVAAHQDSWESKSLEPGEYGIFFVYAKGNDEIDKILQHIGMQTPEGALGGILGVRAASIAAGVASLGASNLGFALVAIPGVALGPAGWAVLVGGAAGSAGLTAFALSEWVTFKFSERAAPEHASMALLEPNTEDTYRALNCEYEPIPINT